MEFSLIGKCMINFIKVAPFLTDAVDKLSDKTLNGTWCVCWQNNENSKKFQIGSIDIKQLFNGCTGYFYSGAYKWPFRAEYKNGNLKGVYINQDNEKGEIDMNIVPKDSNRLKGKWSGIVEDTETGHSEYGPWLKMYFAKNSCFKPQCCIKDFGENEGYCDGNNKLLIDEQSA